MFLSSRFYSHFLYMMCYKEHKDFHALNGETDSIIVSLTYLTNALWVNLHGDTPKIRQQNTEDLQTAVANMHHCDDCNVGPRSTEEERMPVSSLWR